MMRFCRLCCIGAVVAFTARGAGAQSPAGEASRAARPPGSVSDERAQEARRRYERGLQLYGEGGSEGALAEFERAYQLMPAYRLLYNIALIRLQLNDYAQAIKAFQEYLAEGGPEIPSVRKSEVERHLASLKSKVGRVEVSSRARGADILVDDVVVGRVPLSEALVVNPGRRRITIARGGSSSTTVVTVAGQDHFKLVLGLDAPKSQAAAPAGVAPNRAPAYVAWGVTAALAAGTTVAGILALGAMSDLDEERLRVPTTRARLDLAESRLTLRAAVTDILAGATVLAGGAALYFTFSKPSAEPSRGGRDVRIGVGPAGLRFEHRF
ncbi:MAG TPA: hypothetical protein VK540_10545 [Polyangiaceae bacterium]|nr:hypothetical protein [Polyangiaceae bacterium]